MVAIVHSLEYAFKKLFK